MIEKKIYALIISLNAFSIACSNVPTSNSQTNQTVVVNTNPANLPEGLSTNQISLSANSTPGISVNTNTNLRNTGSILGIPDTTKMGKTPPPKNTPPIPGIPDEETLKKQMTTPVGREVMERKPPELEANSNNRPASKRKSASNANSN